MLFLLAGQKKNICVVGDDDQALYRFRGATVKNILEFPEKFQDQEVKKIELDTNYRSHKDIIRFYNKWQDSLECWEDESGNYRYEKLIVPPREREFLDIPTVSKIEVKEKESWNEKILQFIQDLKRSPGFTDLNQIAFLFRSVKNDKVLRLANYLEENGVPVYSPRSNLFFDREEVRYMIGALLFMFPAIMKDISEKNAENEQSLYNYYITHCFHPLAAELGKIENKELLEFLKHRAQAHSSMTKDADLSLIHI